MVRLSGVRSTDAVLEVACGPAFVGLLFANKARSVVGVDLAQLDEALRLRNERHVGNLSLVEGDVGSIPIADGCFDIVACHKAFHHFSKPTQVLLEVRRVLSAQGRLVLGDSLSSEDPAKRALHNQLERLRDPSHVQMYALSDLQRLITSAGFRIGSCETFEDERDFDWWMSVINPPASIAAQIKDTLIEGMSADSTGLQPHLEGDRLWLRRRNAVIAAIKT